MIPTNPLTGNEYTLAEIEAIYDAGENITNSATGAPYMLEELQSLFAAPEQPATEAQPEYVPYETTASPDGPVEPHEIINHEQLQPLTNAECALVMQYAREGDTLNALGYLCHCLGQREAA